MWRIVIRFAVVSALAFYPSAAGAQSGGAYDLTWSTIDSGGATFSGGGAYAVGGTVGQYDAGQVSGPPYVLAGGFWGRVGAVTAPTPTPTLPACIGDCGRDGKVTVDELLTMVSIALGNASVLDCQGGDANGDNHITVDEILRAVNDALNGCG
jgi:hypothetical protein